MISLLPKDTVFYDQFEELAAYAVSVSDHLRGLARDFPNMDPHIQLIRSEEQKADDVAHAALDRMNRTFITPFDREDIHTLVGGLDDIVDAVDALAKRFPLYHIAIMQPAFVKQTETLHQATLVLKEAVHRLRKSRKLSELSPKLIEIHHLESIGDDQNHAAMSDLFSGAIDPLTALKWKELYDLIESAIDGCEDVGNTLERIVLKNG